MNLHSLYARIRRVLLEMKKNVGVAGAKITVFC